MLVLASNSQTRAKILKNHNINFECCGTNFDEESIVALSPKEFVYKATMGKLQSYLDSHDLTTPVLCADSVVTVNAEILRKAKDEKEARELLKLQSGNEVSIITCMAYKSEELSLNDISTTTYKFAKFDEEKLKAYLQSKEWEGKAGACMVEGFCKEFITSQKGFQSTAMGLCVEKLLPFIKREVT